MPEGTLEVRIFRGHGLKDVEIFGASDPFAILSYGVVSHQTPVIHNAGGEPVWEQDFKFDVSSDIEELSISIYDFERDGRNRQMGTCIIPLADVFVQLEIPPSNYEVLLPDGKVHGKVELSLKFLPKVYHGTLELHLMEAHGLISADVFDKSDPYAIIKCNEQTLKSKVMENAGNDPVWDQLFAFAVSSEVTEATITLMDRDTFTPDDPLGDAVIPLEAVFKQGSVPLSKYKVIGSSGKEEGEVVVGLKFVPKE